MKFRVLFFLLISFQIAHAQEQISLEQVIALALERNYDVRIAKKSSEAASLDNDYAYNAFLPRINGTGSVLWTANDQELRLRNSETGGVIEREGPTASKNISGSVQLVWTLFDGLRMFATRERIALLADQGELLVKDQMVNTIATVTTNYYDIVRQKQQLKAILEQMAVSDVRVKLAERKFEVGTGAKPELLQARVDYNAQRAQAIQQETLIAQLKEQLNGLVGMELPQTFDVADTILIDLKLNREELVSKAEDTNYGLQAANRSVRMASLTVRERRSEYLPFIDFNSSYNYNQVDNTKLLNPFSPFYSLTQGLNYGFTISVPIFNGSNQRRLVQQSRITAMQQEILFAQQRTQVNVAVRNAFTNYDNARKILLVEEENISLARENVNIALEVFRRGAGTFLELRTAQQSLADAYTRLINARYLAKVAETDLYRLNGSLLK